MSSHVIEDLTSSILDFQANEVRFILRKKTEPVEPYDNTVHYKTLQYIWQSSKVEEEKDTDERSGPDATVKWRKLGFRSEDLTHEFHNVGVLGLECLRNLVRADPDYFAKVVLEQLNRPPERRCPVATASNEVVELLCEHWEIFAPGCECARDVALKGLHYSP